MKLKIVLLSLVFLAGCAVLPADFDNNEYELLTRLETSAAIMNENCNDRDVVVSYLAIFEYDARLLHTYSFYLPKNTEVFGIAEILKNDTIEFTQQYVEQKDTPTYCNLKTKTFLEKVRTALKSVAEKPRN